MTAGSCGSRSAPGNKRSRRGCDVKTPPPVAGAAARAPFLRKASARAHAHNTTVFQMAESCSSSQGRRSPKEIYIYISTHSARGCCICLTPFHGSLLAVAQYQRNGALAPRAAPAAAPALGKWRGDKAEALSHSRRPLFRNKVDRREIEREKFKNLGLKSHDNSESKKRAVLR